MRPFQKDGSMSLHVNATDWHALSAEARERITRMLHEQRLLSEDESLQIDAGQPSLKHYDSPSLNDPDIAQLLQEAAQAGMEAVSIISCVHHSQDEKLACFVVAYEPCRTP